MASAFYARRQADGAGDGARRVARRAVARRRGQGRHTLSPVARVHPARRSDGQGDRVRGITSTLGSTSARPSPTWHVRASGFTRIIAPDARLLDELSALRGLSAEKRSGLARRVVNGDADTPVPRRDRDRSRDARADGGPARRSEERPPSTRISARRAGVRRHRVRRFVHGAKRRDMDMYAAVLGAALARGERVAFTSSSSFSSARISVRRYAEERGYVDVFERAGATLLDPACGACIRARAGSVDEPGSGHRERHQPQLSRTERTRKGVSGEPVHRSGERGRPGYITASEVH